MTEQQAPADRHVARYVALIPAAGVGARMAADGPKQYMAIGGKPMLSHTVDAFLSSPLIGHVYVVVSEADGYIDALLPPSSATARVTVLRCGGASRLETVHKALLRLGAVLAPQDWVLVHDAARPGLNAALIDKLITTIGDDAVGGLLALPVVDTVKRAGAGAFVATVSRDGLWLAQTPQMFRYRLLCDALAAATDASVITDDASAVEAMGFSPMLVEGHPRNLKVTLPADIRIAEMYLAAP